MDEWRALVRTMEAKTAADIEAEKHVKKQQQASYLNQLEQVRSVRDHEKKMSELERRLHEE